MNWTMRAVVASALVLVMPRFSRSQEQRACRIDSQPMPVKDLTEASGVAVSVKTPGVLWSHNDSGEPVLVAVGADGRSLGRVWIAGAIVEDWEDVNVGPCPQGSCVYIGDTGDNRARRGALTIYRVPEPDTTATRSPRAESMRLTYPDGPKDAEALIVMPNGLLYIVTKGERSAVTLYAAGPFTNGSTARLSPVTTIIEGNEQTGVPRRDRITGGSASRDGRWIALRSLSAVTFYQASDLEAGRAREAFRYDVSPLRERQGEGIAFGEDGSLWLASEGGGAGRPGTIARLICTLP